MSGKTGKGGKRIFIADDPLVPQALELAAKVFRKGSNPRINLSYLIKQESGHHSVVQEWHEILSFLRGKGASGLRKAPPMILESGYDAPKFEAPTVSAASERPLRHAVYVSFEEYAGRVERKRESDKFKVSRFNAPYYLGTWDDLNLPQREFMNEFLPRPIKSGEGAAAKEKNLDALIIEGLTALPKSRRAEFQRLIDDGSIETVREMLDYFSALVQGKPGAFRYKLHRGGFLGTLEKRLMAEDPHDEAALASVQRILYPNLNAAKADFLRVAALSAQIVDEDIGVIFGKWRSDILYASEHDIGYDKIPREKILGQRFRPVHWYRSLPLPEKEHTIGEMLAEKERAGKKKKELRLTAAQAEGILRALPGFKAAARRYMQHVRENYLPGSELKKAFETVYDLFKKEQPAVHEALSEGIPVVGFFPREVRGRLRQYFTHMGYESQNPSQKDRHPREGSNLFDDAQRILSMAELEDLVETLFVESRKWEFAGKMALAEEQKGFMARKYASLVGEEKELILSLIDRIGRCYIGKPGENTLAEREMLTKAGWPHSGNYHASRERAQSLKEEAERGIIPMEYSPKLREKSLWARVIKTLTGFSPLDDADTQKIQYLLQLREIGLDTSRISGATGNRTTSKNEPRFSIEHFADAAYLSEEQRKAIGNVYGSAREIEGIAQLPSDDFERISWLISEVSRIEQSYSLYDIGPGVHYFIPEVRRLQQSITKDAPLRMKGRNGVNVADWEELEKAMERFGDFVPAQSVPGLSIKLEALLDRDIYEAARKETQFFADRDFVERFAEALKQDGEKVMVSKELMKRLENAYAIAEGYREKFKEHGQALKNSAFNPDDLSERVEKAFSQARIGDDGKPVTFNFPPYGNWVMEIGRFKMALRTGSEPLPPDFLNQVADRLGAYERLREFVPPEVLPRKYQASLKKPEDAYLSWKIVSAAPEQDKQSDIKDSMSKFGSKLGEYLNYRWDGVSWNNSGKVAELRRQIAEIGKHNRTQGHYLQIEIVQ